MEDRPSTNSGPTIARRTVSDEVDGYTSSVAGVELESVRAGRGVGPSTVAAALGDHFTFTSSKIGFPMLTHATIGEDRIAVAHITRSSSPASRWGGIDLVPGSLLAYGPGAEHVAVNKPGLEFTFATIACDRFLETANELAIQIEPTPRGVLDVLASSARVAVLCDVFPTVAAIVESGAEPPGPVWDSIPRAVVHALSERDRPRRIGHARRIDSRHVSRACIDYARSIGRIPSISELCLAAHVSERRLRKAFVDEFDRPPSQFFRAWALDAAHRRLVAAEADHDTVTRVAADLGFGNLGRFAGQYKSVYGETPSTTLNRQGVPT